MRQIFLRPAIFKIVIIALILGAALTITYGVMVTSKSVFYNAFALGKYLTLRPDVYGFPGNGGYLYTRPALKSLVTPWRNSQNNLKTILALSDTLGKKGIKLIVVPVPDKEAIVQTYSPFRAYDVGIQRIRMIRMLRRCNVDVIDLAGLFQAAQRQGAIFNKEDHHWNDRGSLIAAGVIADSVKTLFGVSTAQGRYSFKDTIVYEPGYTAIRLGDSSLYPRACRIIMDASGSPFKDSVWSDIMIFGDCFTSVNKGYGGGLGAEIAYFSNRPTFTITHFDPDPHAPAQILNFLKNRKKSPRIIIWVFLSYFLSWPLDEF
jgi:hypothetical protein